MPPEIPQLYLHWEAAVGDLLDRTQRFPKSVRFTFSTRIDNRALDILEDLVEAQYSTGRVTQVALNRADLRLSCLRTLLRLSHQRRYIDRRGFEIVMRNVDTAGRMLGGWLKQQTERRRRR